MEEDRDAQVRKIIDKMKCIKGRDIGEALNKNLDSWNKSQEKFRKEDLRSWELAGNLRVGSSMD